MSWLGTARKGAANEFGRRMWRWFAAFEITRKVAPVVLLLAVLAASVWMALRWSAWWIPRLGMLVTMAAVLGVALWLWQRWRWSVRMGFHRPALALAGLVVLAGAGGAFYWLR